MRIVIIRYNAGNIRSVHFALKRLGIEAEITDDLQKIRGADKVIFPGVGEASSTMEYLDSNGLGELIPRLEQPVLAICLGMQLLCTKSEEGQTSCLSVTDSAVRKFRGDLKIPHMGWNRIYNLQTPLFTSVEEGSFVYFVHSYYVPENNHSIATASYGDRFSAALQKDNFFATQFHPEKSGPVGNQILKNFVAL